MNSIYKQLIIPAELTGHRLDQALALLCQEFSRAHLQQWIRQGEVRVNGEVVLRPSSKVIQEQQIIIDAKLPERENWSAQKIDLNIVYEDQELMIINKPAGWVVHPGAGNLDQTLVNSLLHHDPNLAMVPRAGLIHRLDKDTSGLLVVARNISSHDYLVRALQAREIERIYQAVVYGQLISGGTIEAAIGRHPRQRTKMSVKTHGGKPAVTHYRIITRFQHHTHVKVQLETGRTHQIRIHFAHIKHPVVGDPIYGKKLLPPGKQNPKLINILKHFNRQALHASQLSLRHPSTDEWMTWQAPLPQDMQELLQVLTENEESFC